MRVESPGRPDLTYCTNIHPGETWAEVAEALRHEVPAVKRLVAPGRPFGVGLRLAAEAAAALGNPDALEACRALLLDHGLYVHTLNGFAFGTFHGGPVKERVYHPDWRDETRLAYTDALAWILAGLLPDDREGTISTLPLAGTAGLSPEDLARCRDLLIRHVATLVQIKERVGRDVSLALEPEPCCSLETIGDTIACFERMLYASGSVARLSSLTGLSRAAAEAFLRTHLGVCFDACHLAVEFESADAAVAALQAAGIRICKIQLSAGLTLAWPPQTEEQREALRTLAGSIYLHQVVGRANGTVYRFRDLGDALEGARPAQADWRIHYHVPVSRERFGPFQTTQSFLADLLTLLRGRSITRHLELETYTWSIVPDSYRHGDVVSLLAQELQWVLARLT
ncbi:metabolite traffic protein EboE [Candidatus Nitrospira bockiana]